MYFYIKDNDLELESGKRNCQLSLLMRANESKLTFCLSNSIVGAFYVPKVIASALSRHVNLRSALAVHHICIAGSPYETLHSADKVSVPCKLC